MKLTIIMLFLSLAGFTSAAVVFGAQIDPTGSLPSTSGMDTTTLNVKVLKSDIDSGGGTYFNGTVILFEILETNPAGFVTVQNVEWQIDTNDDGIYDIGEIVAPGNFTLGNPSYNGTTYIGWNVGGANTTGDVFNSTPRNFEMRLSGVSLDTQLNAQLFDVGDISRGQVEFTVDGNTTLVNFDIEVVSVPEPSSTALLGLGGLALILRRRK